MSVLLDYRDHHHPVLVCSHCQVAQPVQLPISITSLSTLVRNAQFTHATCGTTRRPAVRWTEPNPVSKP